MDNYECIVADLCQKYNIIVERGSNGRGKALHDTRTIRIPTNLGKQGFLIALHEVGHIVHGPVSPVWKGEILAERFAVKTARRFGVSVGPKQLDRMWEYISYAVGKAVRRGLKRVPSRLTRKNFMSFNLEKY